MNFAASVLQTTLRFALASLCRESKARRVCWRPDLEIFAASRRRCRRLGDVKGIGPAAFMLVVAAGALAMRILTYKPGTPG
jgi:hypothetical protein